MGKHYWVEVSVSVDHFIRAATREGAERVALERTSFTGGDGPPRSSVYSEYLPDEAAQEIIRIEVEGEDDHG